ncbi:MAG TPA: L-2-hydroxyglutarate oxidase [Flavobacteriales bacterium]|nr:L-2-hydroxyglutarate oxidase [Flavobacteriales bacterium]
MQEAKYDIAIVGGGIVGLAIAYQIQREFPKLNLIILEKEKELAFHQTGRNSGVIHSGLYYKPNSLKAKNCVKGRKQLVQFAKENNIKHDICGKIVLALNKREATELETLKKNGEQNGLENLQILTPLQFKNIEPNAEGVAALWVPQSGIIDYKEVSNKFAELIKQLNPKSKIALNCEVLDIEDGLLFSTKGKLKVEHTIFCGGLFSDRLAKKDKVKLDIQIVGFRGDYFQLSNQAKCKVNNLIYPVPNPEFPFLGIHFTRMMNGEIECGPNAVFTFKREGYKKTDFSWEDSFQALSFSGTWRLFINHWKFGLNEYRRAFSKALFLKELQKMIPTLKMEDIIEGRSGVRAMALGIDGEVIDDFRIVQNKNNLHVLNAPSPAATACLAIGDQIMEKSRIYFNLK